MIKIGTGWIVLLFVMVCRLLAAPGDVLHQWTLEGGADQPYDLATTTDGRIWVTGYNRIYLFESDGTLVNGFEVDFGFNLIQLWPLDGGDVLVTNLGEGRMRSADGSIDVELSRPLRMRPDGQIDSTFSPALTSRTSLQDAKSGKDGTLVLSLRDGELIRLLRSGVRDSSFQPPDTLKDVAIAPESTGGLYVSGYHVGSIEGLARGGVARLHGDGALDRSFALQGTVPKNGDVSLLAWPLSAQITLLPGQKLLVSGGGFGNSLLATNARAIRFLSNGDRDNSWNPPFDVGSRALLEPDGRVILWNVNNLTRHYSDGTRDPSFVFPLEGTIQKVVLGMAERLVTIGSFGVAVTELGAPSSTPPRILEDAPVELTRDESVSFTFEASVLSEIDAQIAWSHNGEFLPGQSNRFLSLASLDPSDSGIYSLKVSDRNGSDEQSVLSLAVVPSTPGSTDFEWKISSPGGLNQIVSTPNNGILLHKTTEPFLYRVDVESRDVAPLELDTNGIEFRIMRLIAVHSKNGNLLVSLDGKWVILDQMGQWLGALQIGETTQGIFLDWGPGDVVWTTSTVLDGNSFMKEITEFSLGNPPIKLPFSYESTAQLLPTGNGNFLHLSNVDSEKFLVQRLVSGFSIDPVFKEIEVKCRSSFRALTTHSGQLILYGAITEVNQQRVGGLVKLQPNGTVDSGFFGTHLAIGIEKIHEDLDGGLLVVGNVSTTNGTIVQGSFRLHSDGTLDTSYGAGYSLEDSSPISTFYQDRVYFFPRSSLSRVTMIHGTEVALPFRTLGGSIKVPVTKPDFYEHPRQLRVSVGRVISLTAAVTGGAPARWRWQRNGVDIPNANAAAYRISNTNVHDTGWYRAIATNTKGTAVSREILIDVVDSPTPGSIDPSFEAPSLLRHHPGDKITAAVQPDGKVLVAIFDWSSRSSSLLRLLENGTLDESFNADLPGSDGVIHHIEVIQDGSILGGSSSRDFSKAMWKLRSNGTRDPTFSAEPPLNFTWTGPYNGNLFPVAVVPVLWQDQILAAVAFQDPRQFIATPFFSFCFDSNGENPQSKGDFIGTDFYFRKPVVAKNGSIYFSVERSEDRATIRRFSGDEESDQQFENKLSHLNILTFDLDPEERLVCNTYDKESWQRRLIRLTRDGDLDPIFQESDGYSHISVTADLNGGVYVAGDFQTVFDGVPRSRVARLLPDGTLDRRFDPGLGFDSAPSGGIPLPSGDMLFYGPFTSYDGRDIQPVVRITGQKSSTLLPMDAVLKQAIAGALGQLPEDLMREDLEELSRLDLSIHPITSIAGLDQCRHLRELILDGSPVADIRPLTLLPSLRLLSIRDMPELNIATLVDSPPLFLVIDSDQSARFKSFLEGLEETTRILIISPDIPPVGKGLEFINKTTVAPPEGDLYAPPVFVRQNVLSWDTAIAPPTARIEFSRDLLQWTSINLDRIPQGTRILAYLSKNVNATGYYRLVLSP